MSILGLTIDYGPFGFLDRYNPKFVPNTTDEQGRYRFEAQPSVCKWNLLKLAEALSIVVPMASMREVIELHYDKEFQAHYVTKLRLKLGLLRKREPEDFGIVTSFFTALSKTNADFTNTFRCLSKLVPGTPTSTNELLAYLTSQSGTVQDAVRSINPSFSRAQVESLKILQRESPQTFKMLTGGQDGFIEKAEAALQAVETVKGMGAEQKTAFNEATWREWLVKYEARIGRELEDLESAERATALADRVRIMNGANPKYILRNYLLQNAIKQAESGDYEGVHRLYRVMTDPFKEHEGNEDLGADGQIPEWACNYVLSCSS